MNTENLLVASEHLAGLLVVAFALTTLWGLTALIGRLVVLLSKPAVESAPVEAPPIPATDQSPSAPSEEPDGELVVIAAATAMLLGPNHRIIAVQPVRSAWGTIGRQDIHASHRVR